MAKGLDSGMNGSGKGAVASAGKESAEANGVKRIEVELLDGSAKDVKVLGENASSLHGGSEAAVLCQITSCCPCLLSHRVSAAH